MSRIEELRAFVETSDRGATLELPHDTARELLAEFDAAEQAQQAIDDAMEVFRREDEWCRADIRRRIEALERKLGLPAMMSTRHP